MQKMISKTFLVSFIISVVVLLAAYHYHSRSTSRIEKFDLKIVLESLLKVEAMAKVSPGARVAVGFGSCLDVIGNGLRVLTEMGDLIPETPENYNKIDDELELRKTFAYFFMHGASAGRITKNKTLFNEILAIMKGIPDTRFTLGGNAPVMTKRFCKESVKVQLVATVPDDQLEEFSPEVSVIHGRDPASDIHLVFEYQREAVWGKYVSKRANRFILYNQSENNFSSLFVEFSTQYEKFQPNVLVVGGLRMMLNFKQENGRTGLDELNILLAKLPLSTKIHLEMSSFSEVAHLQSIVTNAVYYADSIGMNEQELPNLRSFLSTNKMTQVSDSHPRIAVTLDHMRAVFKILHNTKEEDGRRRMTRLHVHTLAYQVIMTAKNSTWKNSKSAVAKAALTANRHTCGSDTIDTDSAMLLTDDSFSRSVDPDRGLRVWFNQQNPVSCWAEEDVDICVAPVLVCTHVIQTVGGGDNVSAAGLVLQI